MDILCATCQEPWNHHHLLFDLPYDAWDGEEGSPSHRLVESFKKGDKSSIPEFMREELAEKGWKFGKTIVCVHRCACCEDMLEDYPEIEQKDIDLRIDLRNEAEAMLGSDLDGLISTLSGIDLYANNE